MGESRPASESRYSGLTEDAASIWRAFRTGTFGRSAPNMGEITESVDIMAPIDRVFAALTDPHRGQDWNPAVTGIEGITPGPPRVGTEWIQSTLIGGRELKLVCTITQLEAPTYGVLEVSGGQRGSITTHCSPIDGGTRVKQVLAFVPPGGIFGQMAGGFVSNAIRREMMRTMERQRDIIEAESGAQRESRTS
jgi:uncharacterized protein YndB with AHSA1/START domain